MSRPSWGHTSRHCVRCGEVGPRINDQPGVLGWVHMYCLTDSEKAARRKAQRDTYVEARAMARLRQG